MKKGSGQAGHRQTASSSVGLVSLKARGSGTSAAAENTTTNTASSIVATNERTGYHQGGQSGANSSLTSKPLNLIKQSGQSAIGGGAQSLAAASGQERKCDSCKYRTPINQCTTFRCRDCGTYIICEYCYEDYMEKGGYYDGTNDHATFNKKIQCVYCWSRHTLTDICVKTLKSLGFMPVKGSNKIQISNLTREKIKKLSNLRVIQKTLVYVIGIAPEIASEEKLKSVEYFGQYGNLQKVVVNTKDVYNATRGGPSYSAYLTFHSARESAIAILSVDQFVLNDRMIRASFGTSKFCQFFLNNQKCNNRDCLYLHELRADLEAYTKEDMQNNKFIFLEQQKIAIKLSKALDLSKDQFNKYNVDRNETLRVASERATKTGVPLKPVLPEPSFIYHKDFHFLDEPLIERQKKREAAVAAKVAAQKAAAAAADEIDSGSTAATTASAEVAPTTAKTGPVSKPISAKLLKQATASHVSEALLGGIIGNSNTALEESKQASAMPIFTNQKDVSNQARKQSQLRAPLSKALLAGAGASSQGGGDSSSAKNSHSTSSNQAYNSNSAVNNNSSAATNSECRTTGEASANSAQNKGVDSKATTNTLFPFEPFKQLTQPSNIASENNNKQNDSQTKSTTENTSITAQAVVVPASEQSQSNSTSNATTGVNKSGAKEDSSSSTTTAANDILSKSKETGATIFQNLLHTQLANQQAQNEKISSASAAAAERFRKKEMNQKKKKKIVVESRNEIINTATKGEQVPATIVEANIKKVDTTVEATKTSPVKINPAKEVASVVPPIPEETKTAVVEQHAVTRTNQKRLGQQPQIEKNETYKSTTSNALPAKMFGASSSQPPTKFASAASGILAHHRNNESSSVQENNNNIGNVGGNNKGGGSNSTSNIVKAKDFMHQTAPQVMSVGSYKKFGGQTGSLNDHEDDYDDESEQSPALKYSRIQSRFQFAHSLDPIKKEGGFKFGFGCQLAATSSEVDKEEILVPMKVQELIHRSIRTMSDSVSERSAGQQNNSIQRAGSRGSGVQLPFNAARDASSSLVPVEEREIEHELETKWYTLEEQAQEDMMMHRDGQQSPNFEETKGTSEATTATTSTNPFRILNNKMKDKEPQQTVGMSNLDVKRVKYSHKQTSPTGDDKYSPEQESSSQAMMDHKAKGATASPFQPTGGKESLRQNKGGRRAGPQAERARQPPNNR